jgi:hypothetical protein
MFQHAKHAATVHPHCLEDPVSVKEAAVRDGNGGPVFGDEPTVNVGVID